MKKGKNIQEAADIIRNGGLVAFPTETVYGLGADAFNPKAIAKIFEVKRKLSIKLINKSGTPVAAPSANRFGYLNPTLPQHVEKQLPDIDYLINGGACLVGIESTVVAINNETFVDAIYVEAVPETGTGIAMMDRLNKATYRFSNSNVNKNEKVL